MQRYICVLFLVMLLTHSGVATGQPLQQLKVVSYNIRHGKGTDDQIDLDRIVNAIVNKTPQMPQLIALQEVDKNTTRSGSVDQAAYIASELGMDYRFGKFFDYQGGEYGMAILSSFPITETTCHPLPAGTESRCALEVKVSMPGVSLPISFVGIHNDSGSDPVSENTRIAQVASIIAAVTPSDYVILAGDFNEERADLSMQLLANDPWDTLGTGAWDTFPAGIPTKEIDFFAVRGLPITSTAHSVINESVASDHRPIYTEINFQEVAGDYNRNGSVDAADYTVWRDNFGSLAGLPNDNNLGTVGQSHFDLWKANFGNPGTGSPTVPAVPEPSVLLLSLLASLIGITYRVRGHARSTRSY